MQKDIQNKNKKMKTELRTEVKEFKVDVMLEMAGLRTNIELVETEIRTEHAKHAEQITDLNRHVAKVEHAATKPIRPPFRSEVTIIATGIYFSEREDLLEKTRRLVHTGLACPDVKVARATQTQWRNNKPGLVKFVLESVDAKIKLLRKKSHWWR